ncbi:MAG: class I SAM-dependent methyltransferase [Chloroflexi bacterium]|nr:class I SAM-dependent methyltransferase [Chloroflexota bacterium]
MQDQQQQEVYKGFWSGHTEDDYSDPHILDGDSRKGLNILVLGCGTGSDCWHLTSEHYVCGMDISESGIAIARAHGIDATLTSVTEPFPYPDASFDIVVAKDILEHILDPLSVMKEVKRVLRPQGNLVTLIPNQFYWHFRLRYLFGNNLVWKTFLHDQTETYEEWNYIHVRFFTWRGVQRFLKVAGFQITKFYFDFGTLEHYFVPDYYERMYRRLWAAGEKKSKRGLLVCYVMYPLWRILNFLFPKRLRNRVVALAPGLLTAGFYLRCTPVQEPN